MDEYDAQRFLSAMGTMFEVFGKEMTPVVTKAYKMALDRYTIEQVEDAVARGITSMKWLPKPADLIDLMGGNVSDIAEVECAKAFKAIRSVGAYQSVCFDNAVTQAVIMQYFGGWIKFCMDTMEKDEHFRKKEFVKIYVSYSRSGMEHRGALSGISSTHNSANKLEGPKDILFIGDHAKCQVVLEIPGNQKETAGNRLQLENITKKLK